MTTMLELAVEMSESTPSGKRYLQCFLEECSAC